MRSDPNVFASPYFLPFGPRPGAREVAALSPAHQPSLMATFRSRAVLLLLEQPKGNPRAHGASQTPAPVPTFRTRCVSLLLEKRGGTAQAHDSRSAVTAVDGDGIRT